MPEFLKSAVGLASFVRPSSAYLADGSMVSSGQPRYETGKFGKALMVEEGTTNLLTANQASVETDTSGFTSILSAVLTRVTTRAWHGSACLQVATPGTVAAEGVSLVHATSIQGNYIAQARIRGAGTVYLTTRVTYSDASFDESVKTIITLNDAQWHYVISQPVTSNAAKTVSFVVVSVRTQATAQAVTFWGDGFQLERKAYPTSWQLPGTSSAAETCSFNPLGIIAPAEGTISLWAYVDYKIKKNSTDTSQMFWHATSGDQNRISLGRSNTNNLWQAIAGNATGATSTSQMNDTLADGWHHFAIRWSAAEMCLFVNGVKATSVMTPNIPTTMASAAFVGQTSNTLLDNVRTWNRALTDAEIAADYASPLALITGECHVLSLESSLAIDRGWGLSTPPLVTPWEEGAAGDPTIRTPYEAGYGQTRPRFTRITWKWSVSYGGLTQADKDTLVAFEKYVKIGADSWTWTDPKTGAQCTVRLMGPIKYRYHNSDEFWSAEFDLAEV